MLPFDVVTTRYGSVYHQRGIWLRHALGLSVFTDGAEHANVWLRDLEEHQRMVLRCS